MILLALLQGRSSDLAARAGSRRPAQAEGRATPTRAEPHAEQLPAAGRGGRHTPSRSSRRPGADTRRPGPRADELEPGAEIQIRELLPDEIGNLSPWPAGAEPYPRHAELLRDPGDQEPSQCYRGRVGPTLTRARANLHTSGRSSHLGQPGGRDPADQGQPTRARAVRPGEAHPHAEQLRARAMRPGEATSHADQDQGPGRCALVRRPATPTSSRGQGGAPW